jgi:hypothetical protein
MDGRPGAEVIRLGARSAVSAASGRRRAVTAVAVVSAALALAACTPPAQVGPDGISDVPTSLAPAQTVTPAPSLSAVPDDEVSVAPRRADGESAGRLESMTVTDVGDADALTFVFADGVAPGYDIRYVDAVERGAGDVLPLKGSAAFAVTFSDTTPAADAGLGDDIMTNTDFGLTVIEQVMLAENLGGTMTFGVGTKTQVPFTVSESAGRLTVTFLHPAD